MKKFIYIVLLLSVQIFSQEVSNKYTASISIGGAFASEVNYAVYDITNRRIELISYNPNLSGKFSFSLNSLTKIYNLNLGLSLEAGYFAASTEEYRFYLGNGKTSQRIIPITLVLFLKGENKLNPLLKFGFGIGNKKTSENFESYPLANVTAEKWFFAFSCGTGLSYRLNETFECAVIFEAVIFDADLVQQNDLGYTTGWIGIQTHPYFGIEFGYSF